MKCDVLKVYEDIDDYIGYDDTPPMMYEKSEVDAAIDELKDKCQMHDFFWEGCGFAKRGFKNTIAVSEAFDKLEEENAELKAKLESVQASMYCDVVDANMENRMLKRALWLARAERAKVEWRQHIMFSTIYAKDIKMWQEIERLCRAKAEEYK